MKPTYEELERQLEESQREFRAADATIHNLELKLTDMAVQLANAESKCREMALENSGMNVFIEEECFVYSSDTPEPIDANDCKPKTPATDAFMAEVRAQARNELLAAFMSNIKRVGLTDGDSVTTFEAHDALKHCIEQLSEGIVL